MSEWVGEVPFINCQNMLSWRNYFSTYLLRCSDLALHNIYALVFVEDVVWRIFID
jgi:hypothetical protein